MNMATETQFTGEVGPHGTKILKTAPTPEELAAKFPQLEILELLGRGGMGAVYKARQKELDRIVALKILPPGIGDDPAFAERFSREAKALAKLNHPNIVTLYEFGRSSGRESTQTSPHDDQSRLTSAATGELYYFLMEYVDGVNLRQLLDTGRVSAREALAIVPQICDALQFAHDHGIVHRDIKPENILMDRRGRVKVADFGLAKIVGEAGRAGSPLPADGAITEDGAHGVTRPTSELTEAGKVMGTPQYMAPEQKDRPLEVDHRADIYALGVVFYQMLTGELPGKELQPPSSKVQIDVRLDEIVLRALENKPELRYQQASVLKTQVETIAANPPDSASGLFEPSENHPDKSGARVSSIQKMLTVPSIGLIVISSLSLLLLAVTIPVWVYGAFLSIAGKTVDIPWMLVIPLGLLMAGFNIVSLTGAWRMRQLRSHTLALVGSILFMLTPGLGLAASNACQISPPVASTALSVLLAILFGTWSLIVLSREDVREAFDRRRWEKQPNAETKRKPSNETSAKQQPTSNWLQREPRDEKSRRMITYGFVASLIGLPIGVALKLPLVWGLSLAGIVLGGIKLLAIYRDNPATKPGECYRTKPANVGLVNEALSRVKAPAIGLLIASAINFVPLLMVIFTVFQISSGSSNKALSFPVLPLAVSAVGGLLAFGAIRMLQLRSYGLCIAASITGMITPPGFLLGLPFGIWSLIVLSNKEVREAFRGNRELFVAPTGAPVPAQPHFSRTAITGGSKRLRLLVAAAMAIVGGIVFILNSSPARVVTGRVSVEWEGSWPVAHAKVEEDYKVIFGRFRRFTLTDANGNFRLPIRGYSVTVSAPGFQTVMASLSSNPLGEIENEEMHIELRRRSAAEASVNNSDGKEKRSPLFGPVTEQALYSCWRSEGSDLKPSVTGLDLDTTLTITAPDEVNDEMTKTQDERVFRKWIVENGIDLFWTLSGSGSLELVSSLKMAGMDFMAWEKAQIGDIDVALATGLNPLKRPHREGKDFQSYDLHDLRFPQTLAFQTLAGTRGILQFTGFTDDKEGIKIRCKLVNNNSAGTSTNPPQTKINSFGPVMERVLPDPDNGGGKGNRETLVLRTGDRISTLDDAPKEQGGRLRALVASKGDLFAEYDDFVSKSWALVTVNMRFSDFPAREWDIATAADLVEALREPTVLQRIEHSGATLYLLPENFVPLTLAFQTRDGASGLLQITKFEDNPRSLKIRYKLSNVEDSEITKAQRVAIVQEAHRAFRGLADMPHNQRANDDVPEKFWGETIHSLKPVRVVNDRMNIKIVLHESGVIESGFYVTLPHSSFAPQAGDFLEFAPLSQPDDKTFGEVYRYKLDTVPKITVFSPTFERTLQGPSTERTNAD